MSGEMRTLGWLALGCVLVAGAISFLFFVPSAEDRRAPDEYRMRTYRIGKISDQQLVALHEKAVQQFEEHKRKQEESGKEYWAARAERQRACEANSATKLRSPNGCYEPLPLEFEAIGKPSLGSENPEKFFEALILGPCIYAQSVGQAKRMGCLPQP